MTFATLALNWVNLFVEKSYDSGVVGCYSVNDAWYLKHETSTNHSGHKTILQQMLHYCGFSCKCTTICFFELLRSGILTSIFSLNLFSSNSCTLSFKCINIRSLFTIEYMLHQYDQKIVYQIIANVRRKKRRAI